MEFQHVKVFCTHSNIQLHSVFFFILVPLFIGCMRTHCTSGSGHSWRMTFLVICSSSQMGHHPIFILLHEHFWIRSCPEVGQMVQAQAPWSPGLWTSTSTEWPKKMYTLYTWYWWVKSVYIFLGHSVFLGFHHRSCLHPVPSRTADITGDTMLSPLFVTIGILICVIMLTIISYHII